MTSQMHEDSRKNAPPLRNLLVSYLQHLGLEVDRFSSGVGMLNGLE
jgi:hypothetical protein